MVYRELPNRLMPGALAPGDTVRVFAGIFLEVRDAKIIAQAQLRRASRRSDRIPARAWHARCTGASRAEDTMSTTSSGGPDDSESGSARSPFVHAGRAVPRRDRARSPRRTQDALVGLAVGATIGGCRTPDSHRHRSCRGGEPPALGEARWSRGSPSRRATRRRTYRRRTPSTARISSEAVSRASSSRLFAPVSTFARTSSSIPPTTAVAIATVSGRSCG